MLLVGVELRTMDSLDMFSQGRRVSVAFSAARGLADVGFLEKIMQQDSFVTLSLQLILCLPVSSADNLGKQFGPRSGPTIRWAWSGSKLFDILKIFLK